MNWLEEPLICLIVFGALYLVIELFARRSERKMLVNKITEIHAEDFRKLYGTRFLGLSAKDSIVKHSSPLRWGMLLLGVGLGLLVGFYMVYYYEPNWNAGQVIYTASICIFGGLALVLSYVIENKNGKH